MDFEILKYDRVISTNDIAIELIKKQQKNIGCICANEQTKGRGTRGKKWISIKGNLFATVFFQLENKYPSFDEFSIINPVIISDAIKVFCKKEKITLKFPNDIFLNKKKLCGILQEVISVEEKSFLIVGIGINVISNPIVNEKYEATNILKETGKTQNINEIIHEVLNSYKKFFIGLNTYNFVSFKKKADLMVN